MRRTKIIVTLGPVTEDEKKILELLKLEVDVFRINFSHGTIKDHIVTIEKIRKLSQKVGFKPAILLDLPGPKIRVGNITPGFMRLKSNSLVKLKSEEKSEQDEIPINIKGLKQIVRPEEKILLVDGRIELKVKDITGEIVQAEVLRGGILHSGQGVNLPNSALPFPSLTQRDKEGIELGFKEDVDWLALSFVRMEEDLIELRDLVVTRGEHMGVIAKVERPEAVRNISKIVEAADAVMVARGDLGVEMGVEEVPVLQKKIVSVCKDKGKPVIIATQMLESMLENPYPTRAEVSDIANAIYDRADCIMLSDETAIGKYPLEAVKVMLEVIDKTESDIDSGKFHSLDKHPEKEIYDAIGFAVSNLSSNLNIKAIVCCTFSGFTAQMLSKYRPRIPIYAFTTSDFMRNKMNLIWGVYPYLTEYTTSIEKLIENCSRTLCQKGRVKKGDVIIFVAGIPLEEDRETNFIKLHEIQ